MPWKKFAFLMLAANCCLVYQICILITNECQQLFSMHINLPSVLYKPTSILDKLTVVLMIESETQSNSLNTTLWSFCEHYNGVKLLLIFDNNPYPPLNLASYKQCDIQIIVTKEDIKKRWQESDPMHYITTYYVLVVAELVKFDQSIPLNHLKYNRINSKEVHLIPIAKDLSHFVYRCLHVDYDYKQWTLKFYHKEADSGEECYFYDGQFAFLTTKSSLKLLNMPFATPFPESIAIQGLAKGFTMVLEEDLHFTASSDRSIQETVKAQNFKDWKLSRLYHIMGIKKVESPNGKVKMYGCSKNTQRCFRSIQENTPEYLFEDRWTPPCCLENLRITFRRVATVLDQCKVRYWLEGGSLLGAARHRDLIPWDYDVDIGIYDDDIKKCPLLLYATKQPIKDDEGFIWEKAPEGDFLRVQFSETNRLHVDIFPFYPVNKIMTKKTWFSDHPQDKEFPEEFVKNLTKIHFAGTLASVPSNVKEFLEFKFGENVISNPQYPNSRLVKFKP